MLWYMFDKCVCIIVLRFRFCWNGVCGFVDRLTRFGF